MRSGASWACNWAMRQLLSIFPPRMVSRKWTFQLSSGHTLPMAAAAPPSAMTVWALPSRDLHTSAVRWPSSTRFDGGAQAGPAGADDDDVVVVGLVVRGWCRARHAQKIFRSENTSLATSRTYRSANATMARLAHAICMCRALSGVVSFHSR